MTNLERARLIVGGMFNRAPANVTNAQLDRVARGLAYRMDPITSTVLTYYNSLSDSEKLAWFVDRTRDIVVNAVAEMEASASGTNAAAIARDAAKAELVPDP